jgi:DNA-directed RNA polymerase specialized sigma24 family protein
VTPSDADVIAASCRDPEQFAALFDRHAPHIHRYLARRAGPQAADDLVAETFLAAFGQRGRYDSGYDDARPWLYGIATNLLGQFRRQEVRRFRLLQAAGSDREALDDDSERTVASLTAQAARPRLAAALAGPRARLTEAIAAGAGAGAGIVGGAGIPGGAARAAGRLAASSPGGGRGGARGGGRGGGGGGGGGGPAGRFQPVACRAADGHAGA